jgi:2-polyprenyl-6-methoxyphenol hydroxylase-like FAD-dependent oxidoreductase
MSRFREWPRTVPQLIEATEEPSITWAAVHDRTPAQRWGVGRITLIGDAAHPMTTNLSQGGCLALEDGVVLAESLTEHANDVVAGLRAYEARRIRRTSPIVLRSRRIALAGGLRSKATCGVRNLFFRVALNGVGLRQHRQEMLAPW